MTIDTPSFNAWLRGQLKEKKMSQRQLALQSGVDHSTISRLIKGDRMPSLGTATKLARGLREIADDADGPAYFASLNTRAVLPTSRVEYALRGDDALTEADVRELMQQYIALRGRRLPNGPNPNGPNGPSGANGPNGPNPNGPNGTMRNRSPGPNGTSTPNGFNRYSNRR